VTLLESIRIALRALRANLLRSMLTMLGMIVGVGAVIAMVAIGDGAQARVAHAIGWHTPLGGTRHWVAHVIGWHTPLGGTRRWVAHAVGLASVPRRAGAEAEGGRRSGGPAPERRAGAGAEGRRRSVGPAPERRAGAESKEAEPG